ncbi:hypothetical protein K0M31_005557 [Melipona bicolor]|uniref:Uncharacterized protein n=1 Tax=Melipona bicolor TaxID=60889 RepID=A0AA40FVU8_9HYME|nr:hypothetical protein K0M31_005557 [Melipona bicolor]
MEISSSCIKKNEGKSGTRERGKSQHLGTFSSEKLLQSTEISATNEIRVQVKRHSPSKLEASKPLILPDASDPSSISLVDHSLATKPFLCYESDEHNAETRSLDGVERLSQQEYAPTYPQGPSRRRNEAGTSESPRFQVRFSLSSSSRGALTLTTF